MPGRIFPEAGDVLEGAFNVLTGQKGIFIAAYGAERPMAIFQRLENGVQFVDISLALLLLESGLNVFPHTASPFETLIVKERYQKRNRTSSGKPGISLIYHLFIVYFEPEYGVLLTNDSF